MTENVKRLPGENTVYYAVEEPDAWTAARGELDSWFCHESLEAAEEVARNYVTGMIVLEVTIKPVSVVRKVAEVERL